jgi:hypothetical protein
MKYSHVAAVESKPCADVQHIRLRSFSCLSCRSLVAYDFSP